MNWTIHQTIMIQHLKVDSVSNSSVLQIGTAGSIRALSNLYNTGGFVEAAPQLGASATNPVSLVPLPAPT
ncbi:spore germination protein GerPB [Paenibacillus sp. Soil787]|uniref:spore germination protein GerPB n=1 Tax=Paenibacillus sp. Soil787 TaxID=1736411 RepID=UPI000703A123|nr:spore germination protein GerPB [Paenibacillus sp. Soil787]KRF30199.1 spore gernimation protein [Paenibacillus sp. Soil787]